MALVKTVISTMRQAASRWFSDENEFDAPPKEGDDKVADFVNSSFKDSLDWRQRSLAGRFTNGSLVYDDPKRLWEDCRKLRNGDHWTVWGRRNKDTQIGWMHEIVWTAIEDQARVRKIYLTSSMHEFDILPNFNHVSSVVRQDMMRSKWSLFMNELVDRGLTDGTSFGMEILDRDLDPDGISRSIAVDPATILPTPGSTSFDKIDGCWYVIYATTETKQQILSNPQWADKIDPSTLQYITEDDYKNVNVIVNYDKFRNTKICSVKRMYLDDDRLESVPFDEEEFNVRVQALVDGVDVPAQKGDAHRKYIGEYIDYLDRYSSSLKEPTEEDMAFFQDLAQRISVVVDKHEQFLIEDANADKRKKYPFGRKIVVVDNQVVEDSPTEYFNAERGVAMDWRRIFYKYDMEKVPGSFWGRGIPEIMWNTNKMMDTFLSRVGDMTLYGLPEKWLNVNDKEVLKQQNAEYTNNPLEPKWYATSPPTQIQASMPGEFILLVQKLQEGLDSKIGVNKTTTGQAPNSRASGDLVETLLQQNTVMITGEADQNLIILVTDIIETKIAMMKLFYTEPRQYIIDGQPQVFVPAEVFTQVDGKPLGEFQVNIKPQSNYPNQWESELSFLVQMMGIQTQDGTPIVDPEMIRMVLGKKFPDLAPGGKYYQMSKATQIGLQVLAQQQKEAEEQAELEGKMKSRVTASALSEIIPSQTNGE